LHQYQLECFTHTRHAYHAAQQWHLRYTSPCFLFACGSNVLTNSASGGAGLQGSPTHRTALHVASVSARGSFPPSFMEPPHPRLLACPPCRPSGTMDPPLMALVATPWTRTLDVTSVSARGALLRNATGACQHGPAAAQVRCNTLPLSSTSLTSQQHWTTAAGTSLSCCRSRQYQFETTSVFTSLPLAFSARACSAWYMTTPFLSCPTLLKSQQHTAPKSQPRTPASSS
jgi:hypothetical protein